MFYDVKSTMALPKMREIFFAHDTFSLNGDANFTGTFHLFKGGRELKGDFRSDLAKLNRFDFPSLEGSLVWVRDRFEVLRAQSDFYGAPCSSPT